MSRAYDLYVSNKFHALYRHAEYASGVFGTQCTLHVLFNFMRYCFSSVPQACVGSACLACPGRTTNVL